MKIISTHLQCRKPSREAVEAAKNAINLFTREIKSKKNRMDEILKKGKITQDHYNQWQKEIKKAETEEIFLPKPNPSDK